MTSMDASAHTGSPSRSQVNGKLDDTGKVSLRAGNMAFDIFAAQCRELTEEVQQCTGPTRLVLRGVEHSFEQEITLASLYFDSQHSVYRGPLDEHYGAGGHSIILADVNADGKEDLLVWTGKEGGYGGPSYDVHIFDAAKGRFIFSQEFSDLTVGYNGVFRTDNGAIRATASDGCCTHIFDTYEISGNHPVLVKRVTQDTSNPSAPQTKTERLVKGQLVEVKE